ncbi:L,D-transpeptidase [Clostridium saccharoperbutylacetonicum]|uniref:L,D-transpeptidase n=1 Tax=Clostridium saccharoperbutylacetonicum TaxID=36745 RepID=UPI001F4D3151|nr:L,D-transpeptidase [Clostridium saccharoperbutylacetonicum]NSB24298.1 hypothetical protein [Clostridium saccharoperbutylacetonicum]
MKGRTLIKNFILFLTFVFIFNMLRYTVEAKSKNYSKSNLSILVDISEERLYLIDSEKNIILKKYIIASGKAETPSPVGTWKVVSMGKWSGGFGTRWIGINVPWGYMEFMVPINQDQLEERLHMVVLE